MKLPRLDFLSRTLTLPAGGASAVAPAIEGNEPALATLHPDFIVMVDAPALTTVQLPDGQTITYSIIQANTVDLSSPVATTTIGVQTGAGGAGASGGVFAGRLNYAGGGRYFGVKATASASAAASGVTVPQQLAAL